MSGNMFQVANQFNLEDARVGFHVAFMQTLEAVGPDALEDLLTEVKSNTSLEEWSWLGDLPGFSEWKGDRKLGDLSAHKLRVANRDWSGGLRAHQNQFKDDKIGLFAPAVEGMARKCRKHRSDLTVKALLNGHDGTTYPDAGNGLAYDGAFFFSTSHSTDGGPSQSNKMTAPLTSSSLEEAEQMLQEMKTADGADPLELEGTDLVVGPANFHTALRLTGAEMLPGSAGTTETNIHRGRFNVKVSRRISGARRFDWFLADLSAPIKPALFQNREEISSSAIMGGQGTSNDSTPRFQRGELWFGAEARYNVALFAWQTIIGSRVPS
jgi:phage major head subunit gpT-like protein